LSNDDGTIDLNSDIVTGGASLLQQINQLPEMLENGWQLEQEAETGEYYVMVSDIRRVKKPSRLSVPARSCQNLEGFGNKVSEILRFKSIAVHTIVDIFPK
jgi:hypothetical protein